MLTDRGLGPALDALATRAPVPVERRGALDERLPAPVEAAAYYVVAEALTNVAKYAQRLGGRASTSGATTGASSSRSPTTASAGRDASRGSGLRGLADRVEALGGRLEVSSPQGEGTTLRATLPCLSGDVRRSRTPLRRLSYAARRRARSAGSSGRRGAGSRPAPP